MHDQNTPADNYKKYKNEASKASRSKTNKPLLIMIAVAAIILTGLWIWKAIEIRNLRNDAAADKQQLREQALRQVIQSHEEHLKLLAKPYVWAVRTELMRGNINQVNLYASDMVKQKSFQRIAIADNKGIVVSSTNKKDEGRPISAIGVNAISSHDTTSIENFNDSILILSSPIMGFNNRLGTLLIEYNIPPVKLQ
jgi:cell division protein FtsL